MVLPPGSSRLARSTSTWIHWWSPVASANLSIIAWSTVIHDDGPSVSPMCLLRSCGVSTTSMVPPWGSGIHRGMLGVPIGAGLIGRRGGENGVLLPRAPHELEARGQAALANAIGHDDRGQARAVAHRAHDVAGGDGRA